MNGSKGAFSAPLAELARLRETWSNNAAEAVSAIVNVVQDEVEPFEIVLKLVKNSKTRALFGAPRKAVGLKANPAKDEIYTRWLTELWGRRCFRYIQALANGLACTPLPAVEPNSIKQLRAIGDRLTGEYKRNYENEHSPESSLQERQDIANFHITYLDPVLLSALILRHERIEGKGTSKAKSLLWDLIRSEVWKGTNHGRGRSEQIADESTLWWGLVELVEHEKNDFRLVGAREAGRNRGWKYAAKVARKLIDASTDYSQLRCPSFADARFEATPEIYGEPRTRMLIAKNAFRFYRLLPESRQNEVGAPMAAFVDKHIARIAAHTKTIISHASLLGIAMELTGEAEEFRRRLNVVVPVETKHHDVLLTVSASNMAFWWEGEEHVFSSVIHYALLRTYAQHYCKVSAPRDDVAKSLADELTSLRETEVFKGKFFNREEKTMKELLNTEVAVPTVNGLVSTVKCRLKRMHKKRSAMYRFAHQFWPKGKNAPLGLASDQVDCASLSSGVALE